MNVGLLLQAKELIAVLIGQHVPQDSRQKFGVV